MGSPIVPPRHRRLIALLAGVLLAVGLARGEGGPETHPSVEAHLERCQAYYVQGNLLESIRELLAARVLDPRNAQVRFMLGNAYFRNGEFEAALGSYETAALLRPGHADTHLNLGFALHRLGNIDAAREAWFAASEMSPEDPMIRSAIALAELKLGEEDAALFHYSIAAYLQPECLDLEYYRRDVRWNEHDVTAMDAVKERLLLEESR